MPLKARINDDLKGAMKAKDALRVDCLRLILSTVKNREIEKRGELDDAEVLKVLGTLAKQRAESIEMYRQGGRSDLVAKEEAELQIVQAYLPKALSEAELAALVAEAIAESGAAGPKDMGKVMKAIGPKVAGRADGKAVSEAVKEKLSQMT